MSVSTPPSPPKIDSRNVGDFDGVDETTAEHGSASGRFTAPKTVGLLVLVLLPYWIIPLGHVASNPATATGFFQYELPYYVANGRAAFERGNGVFYPNPYDPADEAPSIYSHWLPWAFGFLTAKAGFDPGDVILAFTFFASLAFALSTRELVRLRTESHGYEVFGFLGAMLGGGTLCLVGAFVGAFTAESFTDSVLQFDPGRGMWFLNWGRNALFPTEAIYHALVAGCWIFEIGRRSSLANVLLLLLITTHPWSGLELLFTINLWRATEYLVERTSTSRNQLIVSVVALAAFLGYYKVWLPSFPSHAELQDVWELNWSVTWTTAALAYVPVLIPCLIRIRRQMKARQITRPERFLICALFVAVGLAFHDRLIKPVQPLHFTRGYVWMPMFLLGLPVMLEWLKAFRQRSRRFGIAVVVVLLLIVADNLIFSALHFHRQFTKLDGFHLDTDERALLATLHNSQYASHVVLTESETLNYLLPTYAHVRPWLGHHFNTPRFPERKETWKQCFESQSIDSSQIPSDVDLVILRLRSDAASLISDDEWQLTDLQNAGWQGWKRVDDF